MLDEACVYADLPRLQRWRVLTQGLKLGHQQRLIAQLGNAASSVRKGRGMTFSEVRPYQAGDEVRHIDWKVTARSQKTHTKLFSEEHERPVFVLVEQSENLFFGTQHCFKSVLALDVMAMLGWATLNQGDRIGGLVFNGEQHHWVEPKRQAHTLLHLVDYGLQLHQRLQRPAWRQGAWQAPLEHAQRLIRPASKVFIIGDLFNLDTKNKRTLAQLRQHNDVIALHLQDPLEYQLPEQGEWALNDGEHTHILDSARDQQAYQQTYHQAWSNLQQDLHSQRIPLFAFSTDEAPISTGLRYGILRR